MQHGKDNLNTFELIKDTHTSPHAPVMMLVFRSNITTIYQEYTLSYKMHDVWDTTILDTIDFSIVYKYGGNVLFNPADTIWYQHPLIFHIKHTVIRYIHNIITIGPRK